MTAFDLVQQLHELGVVLTPYPDSTLRYKAPKGVLTPELLDGMRQYKQELHALVEAVEERAAMAEYCGGLVHLEAEALAWQAVCSATTEQPRRPTVQEQGVHAGATPEHSMLLPREPVPCWRCHDPSERQ